MANDLVSVSMKNYLSSPNVAKYVEDILGSRKGQFIATCTSLVNTNNKLQSCDKQTVLMAAIKAVSLNLPIEPSLGYAYVIPYGDQAQFQISYKGIIQLALRTGNYSGINSMEVRKGEFVGRDDLGDPVIRWLPEDERLKLPVTGYMAVFKTTSGFTKKDYWTIQQVENHAERFSQGYKAFKKYGKSQSTAKSGNLTNPWESDFDGMAKKTVLKNLLSKYGELSVEMQTAIRADQAVIKISDDGVEEMVYVDNPKDVTPSEEKLSKAQQKEILKKAPPEVVKSVLNNLGYTDISDVPAIAFDAILDSIGEQETA
jgi:recombination protein RecT